MSQAKSQILDAAEVLFAQKGYEGTSLREIALKTGIKQPSLYAHFENKEAIYNGVIDRALLPFSKEIASWQGKNASFNELLSIPKGLLALHAEHPYSAQILHQEFTNPAELISPKIIEWLEQITDQSEGFMNELPGADASNNSKKSAVLMLVTFTNITLGFFSTQGIQEKLLGDSFDKEELLESYNKILLKIFKSLLI